MKLIHCADLHLDSKMSANLDKQKAKERKIEILHTFVRMVDYAASNNVRGILIAGDMFDTKHITKPTRNMVLDQIVGHPDIHFYYLNGNHDNDNFLMGLDVVPENLMTFTSSWTSYKEGEIVISGIDLSEDNVDFAHASLSLDSDKFNIVMLHGQEGELINLRALKNKGIDYLALGHIHAPKVESLDARTTYCYPGCLEGRGFDECGEHGFMLLDIQEESGTYTHQFIPFAKRKLYTISVDVTDCNTTSQMAERVEEMIKQTRCEESSLLKIVLTGMVDVECEKDIEYIATSLKHQFYFAKIYDETTLKIRIEDYMLDVSLKGEYVRMIMQDSALPEEEKNLLIRYGLQAIAGEEVQ